MQFLVFFTDFALCIILKCIQETQNSSTDVVHVEDVWVLFYLILAFFLACVVFFALFERQVA